MGFVDRFLRVYGKIKFPRGAEVPLANLRAGPIRVVKLVAAIAGTVLLSVFAPVGEFVKNAFGWPARAIRGPVKFFGDFALTLLDPAPLKAAWGSLGRTFAQFGIVQWPLAFGFTLAAIFAFVRVYRFGFSVVIGDG